MSVCVYVCMCVCVYVCMCVCLFVCVAVYVNINESYQYSYMELFDINECLFL